MSLYKLINPQDYLKLVKSTKSCRVIPVDSSWYMPNMNRDGKKEFLETERLPNAVYFDIDGIKDTKSPYPHMLPDVETFNKGMSDLGLLNSDILVVYDKLGNFASPRAAWTLSTLGHEKVYLLNNWNTYLANKENPLEKDILSSYSRYPKSSYETGKVHIDEQLLKFEEVKELVDSKQMNIKYNAYDARNMGRYTGVNPEPRPGFPSGHVPFVQPLPFTEVLDPETKEYLSSEELKSKILSFFAENNIPYDENKPTITMCGTGVTGTIIKTALEYAGLSKGPVRLYDGSWTEWVTRLQNAEGFENNKYFATGRE